MCPLFRYSPSHNHARRALSLAEAIVSIAIVGVMLVAALNTVGAARLTQNKMGDRSRGALLAQDLLSEILQQPYTDPDETTTSIGLEEGENSGKRDRFDDADDYDGWSASPPQQKDGTEVSDFAGWGRSVVVQWVSPSDIAQVQPGDTGVKRITVTVTYDNLLVTSLVALRTNAMESE